MSEAVFDPPSCANCGATLTGRFCADCGQRVEPGPPTVRDILHEAADEVLNVDGKVFRTIRLLLTRPGFLTRELFAGRKASYVGPLRLYLTCSVAAFAAFAIGSPHDPLLNRREAAAVAGPAAEVGGFNVTLDMMSASQQVQVQEQVLAGLPYFLFAMVPLFAALVMLVLRRSGRTYPQHLYFALHVHAFVFGIIALTLPLDLLVNKRIADVLSLARAAATLGYVVIALRTAYGGGWAPAAARSMLLLAAYTVLVLVLAGFIATASIFLGWWVIRVRG